MVRTGDTFHAPATLWGKDYAELAYGDAWKDTKEHFRVVSKHKNKPGVWWCAYESADESDVEISAHSIQRFTRATPVGDTDADSSVTEAYNESDASVPSESEPSTSDSDGKATKKPAKNKRKRGPPPA